MSEATSGAAPEFSRILRLNELGDGRRDRTVEADAAERAALARRFGLRSLDWLEAQAHVAPDAGGCRVTGRVRASLVQACVATDEDVPAELDVPMDVRFVRGLDENGESDAEEIELREEDCDILPLEDERIDLGETVAQTLFLNLDPYPRVPDADEKLRALGVLSEEDAGPFAALKGLKLGGAA
ncbi:MULTISPECIES: YceD family protein [unclassified Sphingobium]|uniref:YceD family protein n=1 Tax=unclassified Sphingobium TaxID=2611147 RepID=UPI0022259C3C|nr:MULTISPECIES: DUF177 domain-containing protein [unclassified Sphingobium]MCW2380526.1 uncharacterized metal-binding protein YceD (DUF177 family) [Sphingobium sp. B2D3B]MCW2399367.1 uncharacterized metal-binding protein YceD (DUF177 family) [Sphingobium sp. B2D3C]